jgi:hypothetical protein
MKFEGVALAVASITLNESRVANTPLMQSILRNHNPSRSGDIFMVFQPNYFIYDFDGLIVFVTHGSPWRCDSFVLVVFTGGTITPKKNCRAIQTVDLAPTLFEGPWFILVRCVLAGSTPTRCSC